MDVAGSDNTERMDMGWGGEGGSATAMLKTNRYGIDLRKSAPPAAVVISGTLAYSVSLHMFLSNHTQGIYRPPLEVSHMGLARRVRSRRGVASQSFQERTSRKCGQPLP